MFLMCMNDIPQFLCLGDYKPINFKKEPLEKYILLSPVQAKI